MKQLAILMLLGLAWTACAPGAAPKASLTESPAAASLPWWREAVFYEIFVRSFYDSDGDGIGDFNGITHKLDYLQDLGITGIWLMPIHPSPSYHGYDVLNYYNVNPEYGDLDDFRQLLSQAHSRGMHVIIDLVLNHTSDHHPFFREALRGGSSPYHDWYVWSASDQGGGWHPVQAGGQPLYYYGLFCDCMPDLNYENPAVTAQMENVARFWLEQVGVDGFRLDAAKHLIEQDGRTENTPATHEWLKGFYAAYKGARPDAYAVGEVYGAGGLIARSYTGDQLDQVFNFELASGYVNSAAGGANSGVDSALTFTLKDMPDGNYASFLTNHDQNRVMSVMNGNLDRARLAAFLMLTGPGTPFVYYGEEIGMQGKKPDEDLRRPMQWGSGPGAGFTAGSPWRAPDPAYAQFNVAAQLGDPRSLLSFYRDLIRLRGQHSALRAGRVSIIETGDPRMYAVLRSDENETLLVFANLGDEAVFNPGLVPGENVIGPGSYALSPIFGDLAPINFTVGQSGESIELQPWPSLPAYGMYVLEIAAAK